MLNVIEQAAKEYQERAAEWYRISRMDFGAGRFIICAEAQKWAAHESRMARELLGIETRI